jgi:hypothetical protein
VGTWAGDATGQLDAAEQSHGTRPPPHPPPDASSQSPNAAFSALRRVLGKELKAMPSGQPEDAPSALYFAAVAAVWVFAIVAILKAADVSVWIACLLAGVSAPLVAIVLWRAYVRIRSRESL